MFGKGCNQSHSALFLKYLLDYIRGWAEQFPTYSCIALLEEHHTVDREDPIVLNTDTETEFLQVFNTLVKEHVAFPSKTLFPKRDQAETTSVSQLTSNRGQVNNHRSPQNSRSNRT